MPLFFPCTSKRIQGFQISFYGRGLFSNYNPSDPYVGSYGLRRKVNATESNPQKNVRTSCFVRIFHRQNSVHIHLWRDTCATLSSGARNSWFPFTHTRMTLATNTFTLHTQKGACLLRISSLSDHVRQAPRPLACKMHPALSLGSVHHKRCACEMPDTRSVLT